MAKRIVALFSCFLIVLGGLITRLLLLSMKQEYIEVASSQAVYRLNVCETRGTIYDSKMRSLAGNRIQYKACVAPSPRTSAHLKKRLSDEQYESIENQLNSNYPFVMIVPDGSCQGDGVTVLPTEQRYGSNTIAPHIVGYLGSDGQGVSGMERVYNDYLNGNCGQITATYRVNAVGSSLEGVAPVITDSTGESAAGVALSVDMDVQLIAEKAAAAHIERGAVVVLSLPDCSIRAAVSMPDFEPGHIAAYLEAPNAPLVNRAISAFDTGSVFKLVVAAAALESGVSPDTLYNCEGCVTIGNNDFHCSKRDGHGEIDMIDALAVSCNTYFIELAKQLGGEKLLEYSRLFGFGESIELAPDYAAAKGCLPSIEKLSQPAALANFAFGQGELMASPLQVASMVSVIANGGVYYKPKLCLGLVDKNKQFIKQTEPSKGVRIISEAAAETIGKAMEMAVGHGTAAKGRSPYVTSAAKTGTAQTGIKENGRYILQAWYAGFFPTEQPQYACVVLVEDGDSGGSSAGPVFREIAEGLRP